ncbi:MAG: carbohydrate kinase family protein [Candidatus Paceibacterota bacterium]
MFSKQIEIISIGDITTDAFIRLKDAHLSCKINKDDCEICLPFGAKVPFESVKVVKAVGNAANAAVAAARLGLRTALVSNLGKDESGKECLAELERNKVITTFLAEHHNRATNYHFVLWYGTDRTILVNHIPYDYKLPRLPEPKWIYLTSIAPNTLDYHDQIATYLKDHPKVKLAFQPGTYQIQLGRKPLEYFYTRADVLILNLEEAHKLITSAKPTKTALGNDRTIKQTLRSLAALGPKLVAITNGPRGAYFYDGEHYYEMPIYPDSRPPIERTGCGDAWASTFVSALVMGKTPLEALLWAPVNPMSVAQFVGAQEGLLEAKDIEWWLKRAPESYRPREI